MTKLTKPIVNICKWHPKVSHWAFPPCGSACSSAGSEAHMAGVRDQHGSELEISSTHISTYMIRHDILLNIVNCRLSWFSGEVKDSKNIKNTNIWSFSWIGKLKLNHYISLFSLNAFLGYNRLLGRANCVVQRGFRRSWQKVKLRWLLRTGWWICWIIWMIGQRWQATWPLVTCIQDLNSQALVLVGFLQWGYP